MQLSENNAKSFKGALYILLYLVIYMAARFICSNIFTAIFISNYQGDLKDKVYYQQFNYNLEAYLVKNTNLILMVTSIVAVLIYLGIIKVRKKNLLNICLFSKFRIQFIFVILTCAIFLNIIAVIILNYSYNNEMLSKYTLELDSIYKSGSIAITILSTVVIVPIFEEILFRGLIFNELRDSINFQAAVIIQAVIFSLWHYTIIQSVFAFFFGLLLCLCYLHSRSIWVPISIHMLYNGLGYIIRELNYTNVIIRNRLYFFIFSFIAIVLTIYCMCRFLPAEKSCD